MRFLPLAALLLLLAPNPAVAQTPAPPPAGARGAQARQNELDRAFAALATAPDEAGGALVEQRIRQLWAETVSPAVALLLQRGVRNLNARQPDDALEDFDAALTLGPEVAEAWFLRAQAEAVLGDRAAAARDLAETLRLEPRHWAALQSLAQLQEESGDPTGALRSLQAALAIHPRQAGAEARLRELRRKSEGDAL